MKHQTTMTVALTCLIVVAVSTIACGNEGTRWEQPVPRQCSSLYQWTDTCNVYALKDGDAAILIDLGDGSVLTHLKDIGVTKIEWVVFTHHHREQCQGFPLLIGSPVKIAAPALARELFEKPASFRKVRTSLHDRFTVYGASYVRPPVEPIPVDMPLTSGEVF